MKTDKSKLTKELDTKTTKNTKEKKLVAEDVKTNKLETFPKNMPNSNKKFEKDDLLQFKLLETKYQNAKMATQLKTYEFEKAKAQWEAHGRELLLEIEKGKTNFQTLAQELSNLREELEKKYSINMDKISYHEITGEIYEH